MSVKSFANRKLENETVESPPWLRAIPQVVIFRTEKRQRPLSLRGYGFTTQNGEQRKLSSRPFGICMGALDSHSTRRADVKHLHIYIMYLSRIWCCSIKCSVACDWLIALYQLYTCRLLEQSRSDWVAVANPAALLIP